MSQNVTMVVSRAYIAQESRADLWDAWLTALLAAMEVETPTIRFLEKVSIMKVSDLQDVIVSVDLAREHDDRTVAYELRHEALRLLVASRGEAIEAGESKRRADNAKVYDNERDRGCR